MNMSFISRARVVVFRNLCDVDGHPTAKRFETFITSLIIMNLIALVLEHIPTFYDHHEAFFGWFDRISIYIFTAEYALRLFAAGGDPRFQGKNFATLRQALTPFALIDALVIVPYWLHMFGLITLDLRVLRALRLLRLLKLLRDIVPAIIEFRRANAANSMRQKVNALMNDTPTSGRLHHQIDFVFIMFIIASVIAVFLETVPAIYEPLKEEFHFFDLVAVAVFTFEYLLRFYAAPETASEESSDTSKRWSWFVRPTSIIDLIAILPFYLQFFVIIDLRFVRVLRVLRILKLTRYNTAIVTFAMVMKRERSAFTAAMFIVVLITILSGAIVYTVEHPVQPEKFDTMPRALYWAVITLASVGYGDISPVTPIGQREQMLRDIEIALEDGILTTTEAEELEQERIRLHISEAQFEKMKRRAMLRHADDLSIGKIVHSASEDISRLRETLHSLPADLVFSEINKLDLPEAEQSALRVLVK